MKVGTLVALNGPIFSSYEREGEIGLVLDDMIPNAEGCGDPNTLFSRVLWGKDGKIMLYKTDHLKEVGLEPLSFPS